MTTLLEPLRLERPQPDASPRQRVLIDWLLILALLAIYAALQSTFVRPPQITDHTHYLFDGANLPVVTWPAHQGLRIGLTIPVWVLTKMFGYSEAAYYVIPYATAVGLVISTYWLARMLDSRAAGVLAGLLIIGNPLVIDQSSQLLPDLPAAALLMAAVTLLLWQWRRVGTTTALTVRDQTALVGVGVVVGWSYLVREFIVFWFPAVVLVMVLLRLPAKWWRLVGGGAVAMFVFELGWGLAFHGDAFARIHAAMNQPESQPWRVLQREHLIATGELPNTHLDMLTALPRALVEYRAGWVTAVLFVLLIVGALVLRAPGLRMMALWTVVPLGLLMAAIQFAWLFDNRILRAEKLRYWLPVLPPLVVGGVVAALALGRWLGGQGGRRAAIGLLSAMAIVSGALTVVDLDEVGNYTGMGRGHMLELREWAATGGHTCDVLWMDTDQWRASSKWAPMYLRTFWGRPIWDGQIRYLNRGDDFVDIAELDRGAMLRSRVALQRRYLEELPVPEYLRRPPGSWPLLLATDGDRIRVVGVGDRGCASP